MVRARVREELGGTVFCTCQGHHTQELTAAVLACTGPAQGQARQHSSMEWGGAREPSAHTRSY